MQKRISQEKASSTMQGNDIVKKNTKKQVAKAVFCNRCQFELFDP